MNDADATDAGDGRWLTYGQLADARQIGRRAAIRLAQRHRLRRQPGNDGQTLVWVPDAMATSSPHRPTPPGTDADDTSPDVAFHTKALAVLEAALVEANKRADAALAVADRTLVQLAEANGRAARAEAEAVEQRVAADQARGQAHALHAEVEAARIAQAEAEADAVELRIAAEGQGRGSGSPGRCRGAAAGRCSTARAGALGAAAGGVEGAVLT